ncbi:hypothetical protein SAMN05192574_101357 [Mucilaginibacter gossypiicola]|uniref:Uncharacterized protein n=1 Tax=Mucilaginibacter gossypiicola TaxID=551995 RepID=A0A1H8A785_9SPHI|nr:hypothetical protein [Mucilaginibacter gossypiicola]SEM65659.1 hypothetical protein SAMN05192574_101357 [Mucilaginibacter gossypiicola]
MNKPLISFHGKQEIKDAKIADIKRHQVLDNLRQGSYWENQKGCAVTCTMFSPEDFEKQTVNTSDIHGRYETQLGIPRILARLEDRFFEGMTVENSKEWPLRFIEAVPVGVNLENVWRRFMAWMLADNAEGVIKFAKNDKQRKAIQDVADAFTRSITETVTYDEWAQVRNDAAAAAADAAYAAAAADAAYAADAAADADAARTSARKAHFFKMSEKLLELLREAA